MTHYTVTYTRRALDALAQIWLDSSNRQAVADAGDAIDQILRTDAPQQGFAAPLGFRQLIEAPLVAEFTVEEDDLRIIVWTVRHVGELTNGH